MRAGVHGSRPPGVTSHSTLGAGYPARIPIERSVLDQPDLQVALDKGASSAAPVLACRRVSVIRSRLPGGSRDPEQGMAHYRDGARPKAGELSLSHTAVSAWSMVTGMWPGRGQDPSARLRRRPYGAQ